MNRRQIMLGSAAVVATAAVPPLPDMMPIMPLPYAPPARIEAYKIIWDAKAEVMRMTYITPEMLYR